MKLKNHSIGRFAILMVAGAFIGLRAFAQQSVLMNPQPYPVKPVAQQEATPGPMDVFIPADEAQQNDLPEIFQYNWLNLRPHFTYSFIYGDDIQSAPGSQEKTIVQQFSPGILLELGRHWALDYTPTIRMYSSDKFQDGVDHSITLNGGTTYNDWQFGLSQNYLYTTQPTAETGSQAERQNASTGLSAAHILNDELSVDFGVNQNLVFSDEFESSRDWSTMEWLNYQFSPRFNMGIGGGGGYVNVDAGSDQSYEELQLRLNWRATDKLSFSVNGGGEDRQFLNVPGSDGSTNKISAASDLLTPIFGASVQYQPFEDTQISLSGSRSISPSLFENEIIETTTVGANLTQTLLKKFQLGIGVGYTQTDYRSAYSIVGETLTSSRTDEYYFLNVRLSHPFFRRGTWGISYQYNDNQSGATSFRLPDGSIINGGGFAYHGSQIGFDISYRY